MYVRNKGDGFTFGFALVLGASSLFCGMGLMKNFYKVFGIVFI
jgi:hypothetical protein